ncbi:MAG TPA: sigma 54-interacting transcriptional regulator [Methylomirabilota bacterium]|nr:sigma 54-interacting transcriptional regulator [Methylomirabilota bacterium]
MSATKRHWTLLLLERGQAARHWVLPDGVSSIGRDPSNAVPLADASVSRRHAELTCGAGGVRIRDCGSRNGVLVNGVPRQEAALQIGDRISIGSFELELAGSPPPVSGTASALQQAVEQPAAIFQTAEQPLRLPEAAHDRHLATLYHVCFWVTEGLEEKELVPKCLRLLAESFRAQEIHLYSAEGRLEACHCAEGNKPAFKLAGFLARKFQESPEAVMVSGSSVAVHQKNAGQFNYLVGPLRAGRGQAGPFLVLVRPAAWQEFTAEERVLLQAVCQLWVRGRARATQVEALRRENVRLKEQAGAPPLLGAGPVIEQLRAQARKAAATNVTVLLQGETGSGKEVLAHFIHEHSPRRTQPFVKVNCAAIPAGLIERELFGHVKGAFTDAHGARQGKFALADGGTLLLDEIGELPPTVQAKVLRALENGEIEPLGAERVVRVDVRILAATHRDLASMTREGRFREDLLYRLNVVQLRVPPLREHPEDIGPLAAHFLDRFCADNGLAAMEFAPEAVAELQRHAWPGNVRELRNLVQRCAVLAQGPFIGAETVRAQLRSGAA